MSKRLIRVCLATTLVMVTAAWAAAMTGCGGAGPVEIPSSATPPATAPGGGAGDNTVGTPPPPDPP
jgi:predicted small lipoprotein YifL